MAALPLQQTCYGPVGAREAWKEDGSKSGEDRVSGKSILAHISHGFLKCVLNCDDILQFP